MAKNSKALNTKMYAVIVFFVVAGLLATITVTTYKSRYNGFSAEKMAIAFTESIVNRGDGYNAYKNTVVSKNYKYGDYIREYYMYPVIYRDCDYKPGDDRDDLKGYNDESFKSEKTLNDTGALSGQVIDTMYPYYVQLIEENNGWDNYDLIFTSYFDKLIEVRENVFGDKYMTDEIMFTALEANVSTYGDSLTGTDEIIDENTGLKTSEKSVGLYEKKYGEDYKITYKATNTFVYEDISGYTDNLNTEVFDTYKVTKDDINDMATVTVDVLINDEVANTIEIHLLKIKDTWYVDNTTTKTAGLYELSK